MIIFVRHCDTLKDPNKNASFWELSDAGKEQATNLAKNNLLQKAELIYASNEIKTSLSITPLAQKLNLNILINEDLGEVRRGDKFLSKEEFELEKNKQLEDLNYPAFGGETGNDALERFEKAINQIILENKEKTIIIVSHGTILNLYFAKLLNKFDELKDRWSQTKFGAIGIVDEGKVIKDIYEIFLS